MIIHVVKQGETISSIAEYYGVSVERLALENGVPITVNFTVGETLVILKPEIVYEVQEGDTLTSIASGFNISIMELLRNNPYLSERENIYPGEHLVIKYYDVKIDTLSTNGYVYPFVSINVLKKTLPLLTYTSIYSHYYTITGEIIPINDAEIISMAWDYGVAPMMVLTGFATSSANEIEVTHNIVINQELQDYMINGLLSVLKSKKYYGINLTNTYVLAEDRILYVEYIRRLSTRLNEEGYKLFLTLTRSAFEILTNVTYEDLRYDILGQLADNVAIITYEWGFSYGLPPTIVAFETINEIILYGKSLIQADKLNFGYSTIGYIWRLPYIDGATIAQSITYNSAINLAREHNATIYFDDTTKASYFQFLSSDEYIVRFRDVRGINSILQLVPHYGAEGVSVWMYNSNNMNINSARCEKAPSTILWTSTQYRSI